MLDLAQKGIQQLIAAQKAAEKLSVAATTGAPGHEKSSSLPTIVGKLNEIGAILAPLDIEIVAQSTLGVQRSGRAALHVHRERAREGAPRERTHRPAGAGGRFGHLRRRAGRRARRAFRAVCGTARGRRRWTRRPGCAQQSEAARRARKRDEPARALLLRDRAHAPRRRSAAYRLQRQNGTAKLRQAPRGSGAAFGLRPAIPDSRVAQDRCGIEAGREEPHQPHRGRKRSRVGSQRLQPANGLRRRR